MKRGTVVYLTDAAAIADAFDEEVALRDLGLSPDWTIIAASGAGYYGVEDAVRLLIERGAALVEAVCGRVQPDGRVQIFGDPLRVYG